MSDHKTQIEWTGRTWKFFYGCDPVSAGCANCYAAYDAATRLRNNKWYATVAKMVSGNAKWTGEFLVREQKLVEPFTWREPDLTFVNNTSDTFHRRAPRVALDVAHQVMAMTPNQTYQLLTKRALEMFEYYAQAGAPICAPDRQTIAVEKLMLLRPKTHPADIPHLSDAICAPNIWKGVSVESAEEKSRIHMLRNVPASVRFVSFEPLLGDLGELDLRGIHWAIFGGESAKQSEKARDCHLEWIRNGVRQCRAWGVKVFVKQVGTNPVLEENDDLLTLGLAVAHKKGGDPGEWPEDLRIREFPGVPA